MKLKEFKKLWKDGNGFLFDNHYEKGKDYFTFNNVKIEFVYEGTACVKEDEERRLKCYYQAFKNAIKEYPNCFLESVIVVCTSLDGNYVLV